MITTLRTPRLSLQALAASDEADYVQWYGDPATMRHIVEAQAADAARRGFRAACRANAAAAPPRRTWMLRLQDGQTAVGLLGLVHDEPAGGEVGAVIPPRFQGRGYATEAIAALATHAFADLGLQRLHTRHADGHGLAAGLMAGLGFRRTADAGGAQPVRWQLLAADWTPRQ